MLYTMFAEEFFGFMFSDIITQPVEVLNPNVMISFRIWIIIIIINFLLALKIESQSKVVATTKYAKQ